MAFKSISWFHQISCQLFQPLSSTVSTPIYRSIECEKKQYHCRRHHHHLCCHLKLISQNVTRGNKTRSKCVKIQFTKFRVPSVGPDFGSFRKSMVTQFSTNIWKTLWNHCEKHHLFCKNCCGYFLGHFCEIKANFILQSGLTVSLRLSDFKLSWSI